MDVADAELPESVCRCHRCTSCLHHHSTAFAELVENTAFVKLFEDTAVVKLFEGTAFVKLIENNAFAKLIEDTAFVKLLDKLSTQTADPCFATQADGVWEPLSTQADGGMGTIVQWCAC